MNTQLRNKPEINKHSLTFGKWCVDLVDLILFVHKVELFLQIVISMENNSIAFPASPKKHRLRGCKCCQKPRRAVLPKSHDFAASWPSCRSRSDAKGWSYEFIGSYMIKLCISVVPVDMVVVFAYLLPSTTRVCNLSMSCILLYLWNVRRWRSTSTLTTRWDRRESATKAQLWVSQSDLEA